MAVCFEGDSSQSMAQARTGSAQMAVEGGVDQIREATQPWQVPGLLGFQSLGLLVLPQSCFSLTGTLGEGRMAPTDYSGLFFSPVWG